MPPSSEQGNDVEQREQRNIKPNHPTAMYNDVILSTSQEHIDSDFPAKSSHPVAMYNDICSTEQHDLKGQNTKKSKLIV